MNSPIVHINGKADYKSMLMDKETIDVITKNIAYPYPGGVELSLNDKYNNYYFKAKQIFKVKNWDYDLLYTFFLAEKILYNIEAIKWFDEDDK